MSEASPLKALTRETKALIIVSEFEAQRMPRPQLRAVLNELVIDEDERLVVLELVQSDLQATGYHPKEIAGLLDELRDDKTGRENVNDTRLFRRPFALGLGEQSRAPAPSPEPHSDTAALPRPSSAPAAVPMKASAQAPVLRTGPSRAPRVLLADDDKHIRMMLRVRLQKLGCTIVEANDGESAWQILRTSQVDLAVLDMKMPGLHGTELLARMLDQGITPPVVVCSAHDQHRQEAPVARYPKLRYLVKPVPAEAMEKAVRDMLELVKA
jgi:CheY-like chemotaxis protein